MRLSRTLGRVAATGVASIAIAGAAATAAFAAPNQGTQAPPNTTSYQQAPPQWNYNNRPQWWNNAPAANQYNAPQQYSTTKSWSAPATTWTRSNNSWGNSATQSTSRDTYSQSGGNWYAWGNCTWYAYERRVELGLGVASNWGNANTWGTNAAAAGYIVTHTPTVGSIMVSTAGYYGHVAIVESVAADGSFTISEMNYAGYNVISTRTLSAHDANYLSFIA
ncbi:MAG: CHAP domain-containing protein [Propionibacteriaceae bacterium]